jgi:GNAT superfamily N-acetyltransferase
MTRVSLFYLDINICHFSFIPLLDTMTELEKLHIRRAISSDLPKMLPLMDEAFGTPTLDQKMDERLTRWSVTLNDTSQSILYVAEIDDNNLVGWCRGGKTVKVHEIVDGQTYDCEILHLFVRPRYQRRGIGRKLWQVLWNDILRTFHPKNFVVWSVVKEQAYQFYASLGGIQSETRKFERDADYTAFVWNDLKLYESTSF